MKHLDGIAERIEQAASLLAVFLDRHPGAAWCVFSVFYFSAAAWRASRKPFWFDELATLHLCRLPTIREVWLAFQAAADSMPPLLHLLTRASIGVFGEGHISVRAPAMVGVWIACFCLYVFVRRHCPAVYGWVAALTMALAMALLGYTEEARSYGLWMGFTGAALLCWQSAGGRHRRLCLFGLALSLAAAIFSHSMAVLTAAVLGLGELARAYLRRKVDWPVFAALLAGAAVVLFLLPAGIAASAAYSDSDWSRPRLLRIAGAYRFLLQPLAEPLCMALAAAWVWRSLRSSNRAGAEADATWRMPPVETVIATGLLLLPVLTVAAAYATKVLMARYTLPALAGFCILTAYLSCSVKRTGQVLAVSIVATGAGWLALDTALKPALSVQKAVSGWAPAARQDAALPIVVDDPLAFLQQVHYAPTDIVPRLVFLADPVRAQRASGNKLGTTALILLARWAPLRVQPPDAFLSAHRKFYLLGTQWFESWLRAHLLEAGGSVRLIQTGNFGQLYLVEADR